MRSHAKFGLCNLGYDEPVAGLMPLVWSMTRATIAFETENNFKSKFQFDNADKGIGSNRVSLLSKCYL